MKPKLIIISGFPATGKTRLAKEISKKFELPLVCADEIKELMFDRIGNWENSEIFDGVSKASYDMLYYSIGKILSTGKSCIMEAFLRAKMAKPRIAKLKKDFGCDILQIQMWCHSDKLIDRFKKRIGTAERHLCHPDNFPLDEFITKKGKSDPVEIEGETVLIDSSHFNFINSSALFEKISAFLSS